nr:PREDICTED: cytohesin-interacting protein [Opisthocomus hoazin]
MSSWETSSAGAIGPNLAEAEEESQLTSPWSRSSCPAEEDASLLPPARYGERGQMPCGHLSLSRMDALKQLALTRSSSLGDSSRPQRHLVAILKEDKETFGFEIQTIRFPHQNDYSLEVCTCICKIQEESPAHLSGLQAGDILASINGVNTDGFSHKQIVELIKSAGNYLR